MKYEIGQLLIKSIRSGQRAEFTGPGQEPLGSHRANFIIEFHVDDPRWLPTILQYWLVAPLRLPVNLLRLSAFSLLLLLLLLLLFHPLLLLLLLLLHLLLSPPSTRCFFVCVVAAVVCTSMQVSFQNINKPKKRCNHSFIIELDRLSAMGAGLNPR